MERKSENEYSYNVTSKKFLEIMKRNSAEGNFDRAFGHLIDLTKEDDEIFLEFLKSEEMQKKIGARIQEIAEIIKNPKEIGNNLGNLISEAARLMAHIEKESLKELELEDKICQIKNFMEDQNIDLGAYGLSRY